MAGLRGLRRGSRQRPLAEALFSGRGAAATAGELAERAVGAAASLRGADVALGVGVLRLGERAAAAIPGPLASRSKAGSVIHDCPERTAELSDCAHGSDDTALSLIHISEPTRLGMISYAVFCLKKKK